MARSWGTSILAAWSGVEHTECDVVIRADDGIRRFVKPHQLLKAFFAHLREAQRGAVDIAVVRLQAKLCHDLCNGQNCFALCLADIRGTGADYPISPLLPANGT